MKCIQCGATSNLNYHHKHYRCNGGADTADNLQVLCRECHIQHHSASGDFATWGAIGGKKTAMSHGLKTLRNLRQFQGIDGAKRWALYKQQYEIRAFYSMLEAGYY